MTVLVTGGLFVGIHLVHHLAEQGERIVCADLLAPDGAARAFLAPVAERVRLVPLHVTEREVVRRLVHTEEITIVVHAAVTPDVRREWSDPTPIIDVNLGGTLNVLDAARSGRVERVLLLSSSGVYGTPARDSTSFQFEDGPFRLDNLYSITKYSRELQATRYAPITAKPSLPSGSRPPTADEAPGGQPRANECAAITPGCAPRRSRVRVAGADISRDWTYMADIAVALGALLRAPRWNYPVYNVSCGRAVMFRKEVAAFECHGLRVEWVEEGGEAGISMRPGQERTPLDMSRLAAETGFTPRYDIATGVASYVRSEAAP